MVRAKFAAFIVLLTASSLSAAPSPSPQSAVAASYADSLHRGLVSARACLSPYYPYYPAATAATAAAHETDPATDPARSAEMARFLADFGQLTAASSDASAPKDWERGDFYDITVPLSDSLSNAYYLYRSGESRQAIMQLRQYDGEVLCLAREGYLSRRDAAGLVRASVKVRRDLESK